VNPVEMTDRAELARFLARHNADLVARNGELVDATIRPALAVRTPGGELGGVLTYDIVGDQCEILTLHVEEQWSGAGTALVGAVKTIAADAGCRRLWVVTTNDNVDALRFYQRAGSASPRCGRAPSTSRAARSSRTSRRPASTASRSRTR
jgi:GNAT superfamily N-acetyltransferase